MFWRKKSTPPEITSGGFARWLRAGRPPFEWFAELPEAFQDHLAELGDQHSLELALTVAAAVRNPQAFEEGLAAERGDPDADVSVAMRAVQELAAMVKGAKTESKRPMPFPDDLPSRMPGPSEGPAEVTKSGDDCRARALDATLGRPAEVKP